MKGVKLVLGDELCPVTALLSYLAIRSNSPMIINHYQSQHLLSTFIKLSIFLLILYSGHSFRLGATTTAAAAGISNSTIQTLGRWQSSAYLLYVRLKPTHLANLICHNGTIWQDCFPLILYIHVHDSHSLPELQGVACMGVTSMLALVEVKLLALKPARWAGNPHELGKKLVEGSHDIMDHVRSSRDPAQHSQMLRKLGTPPWHTHHPTRGAILSRIFNEAIKAEPSSLW